jgi:hypothetical protein
MRLARHRHDRLLDAETLDQARQVVERAEHAHAMISSTRGG